MTTVRTRLAPSPTSAHHSLHLGNVRTGLFAYLYAKKHGGTFYLRIEDSDAARNVPGCAEGMLNDLHWLGLSPDEGWGTNNQPRGPYTQSERAGAYKEAINHMLERGMAYRCICSTEQLNELRDAATKRDPKNPWKYPGTCRNLKSDPEEGSYVVRFKSDTTGETVVNDMIFGRVVFPHKENYDWVIARRDGSAMYNLAVVVDDIHHGTTVCIRGKDHLQNTLMQVAIYNALGASIPQFAHLPMVNSPNGQKMSKRDNSELPTNVKDYRALGYAPGAVLNYLARLSWAHGNQEIFSKGELIELFDLSACGRNDGRFDPSKLMAVQYAHMKSNKLLSDEGYVEGVIPLLQSRGIGVDNLDIESTSRAQLKGMVALVRQRCKTFAEAANDLEPILRRNLTIDKDAAAKFLSSDSKKKLHSLGEYLRGARDWSEANVKWWMLEWLTENNLTMKEMQQPIRVASIGKASGPELFSTLVALGKDRTIERLSQP